MTPADKKKLAAAGAVFGVALAVLLGYAIFSGGHASREAQSAQQKVLEKMGAEPSAAEPAAESEPAPSAPPAPADPPAGKPRSVRPGH